MARPTAKWGDREARRRDILDAARGQLAQRGYVGLNMREIARGAGVSPATLYAYFDTKDAIFATLYAEAMDDHSERLEPICNGATSVAALFAQSTTSFLPLYRDFGRHLDIWSLLLRDPERVDRPQDDVGGAMRRAALRQGRVLLDGYERAAAAEGMAIDDPGRFMMLVWSVMTGLSDQFTSDRRLLHPYSWDDMVGYASRTVVAALEGVSAPL